MVLRFDFFALLCIGVLWVLDSLEDGIIAETL